MHVCMHACVCVGGGGGGGVRACIQRKMQEEKSCFFKYNYFLPQPVSDISSIFKSTM